MNSKALLNMALSKLSPTDLDGVLERADLKFQARGTWVKFKGGQLVSVDGGSPMDVPISEIAGVELAAPDAESNRMAVHAPGGGSGTGNISPDFRRAAMSTEPAKPTGVVQSPPGASIVQDPKAHPPGPTVTPTPTPK